MNNPKGLHENRVPPIAGNEVPGLIAAAVCETVIDRMLVAVEPTTDIEAGANAQVAPTGNPAQFRVTGPLKTAIDVKVIASVPVAPRAMLSVDEFAANWKSSFVRAKVRLEVLLRAVALTSQLPLVELAIAVTLAMPLALIDAEAADRTTLGPDVGAVNVTVAPAMGDPAALTSNAVKGVLKAVPTTAAWPPPADAVSVVATQSVPMLSSVDCAELVDGFAKLHEKAPTPFSPFSNVRVGLYTLLRPLGSGGIGTVYIAERMVGGAHQRVALKVLAPHAAGQSFIDRFHREQHILGSLDHPNITRLIDAGLSD